MVCPLSSTSPLYSKYPSKDTVLALRVVLRATCTTDDQGIQSRRGPVAAGISLCVFCCHQALVSSPPRQYFVFVLTPSHTSILSSEQD